MPSNWDNVIGQDHVKQLLQTAVRNKRIAHAYLFYGIEGAGQDAIAIEFARVLLCRSGSETACGECASCRKMDSLQHPNVTLIFPMPGGESPKSEDSDSLDANVFEEVRKQTGEKSTNPYFHIEIPKAKVIPIRSIRAIKKESSMSSAEEGRKIFIIFDADAMKDEAANALLKVLEEPLEGTHFLLATSRRDALKQTIISRCQQVRCSLLQEEQIAQSLIRRRHVDSQRAAVIASLANGSYTRAVEMIDGDIDKFRNDAVQFLRSILGASAMKLLDEQDEYFTGNKRDNAEQLLSMLIVWFRDSMMIREGSPHHILNRDQEEDLNRFVQKFGRKNIEECLRIVEQSLELLRRNVYLPLVMLSLTVRLRTILHAK